MFNTILLSFGYAEDANLSFMPFAYSGKGFKTRAEAITSLAEQLKSKWLDSCTKLKNCCETYQKQSKNFCADCGRDLTNAVFDVEDFVGNFLLEFPTKTYDSYGFRWEESQETEIWTPEIDITAFFKTKNTLVLVSAERVLAAALDDPKELQELIDSQESDDPNIIIG